MLHITSHTSILSWFFLNVYQSTAIISGFYKHTHAHAHTQTERETHTYTHIHTQRERDTHTHTCLTHMHAFSLSLSLFLFPALYFDCDGDEDKNNFQFCAKEFFFPKFMTHDIQMLITKSGGWMNMVKQ